MSRALVLTLDIGTSGVKASVFSTTENRLLTTTTRACPIDQPAPHRAEWQPETWWPPICQAMAAAVAAAGRPRAEYLGLTVASLRQGFVLLDEAGEPVLPGVLNYDRRGAAYTRVVEEVLGIERLYRLTGHWPAPELTLPKLLWVQRERPQAWRRVRSLLFVHDWALSRLTGQRATAASMITAGQMGDCTTRDWAYDLLAQLGIPAAILPPVHEGGMELGPLLPGVAVVSGLPAGLPVFIGGGDTQFSSLGVEGAGTGRVVIVGGSTTPLMMTSDKPLFDPQRCAWVSPHLRPGLWAIEANAGHTGLLYRWFRDTFAQKQVEAARALGKGDFELLDELAAHAPLGADGLLVVATSPRWAQDTWERKAPYVFHNFDVAHTLGHAARAVLEGACYGVRGNLEQLQRVAGHPFERIVFTGGAAQVPLWTQMLTDVLGQPVAVPQITEPAARAGAQLVVGAESDQALSPPPLTIHEPDLARHTAYEAHYHTYLDVFEKMQRHFGAASG